MVALNVICTAGGACGFFNFRPKEEGIMKLIGSNVYVRPVEESDADMLLALKVKNRHFFQQFTGLREASFYTLQGQADRIK